MPAATLEEALDAFDAFLRARGLRMTGQRRTLVRAALEQRGHFTAEDLHHRLVNEGEHVSLATVYRALLLLAEASIVEGHDFADGQRRFEPMLKREHHDHMVCRDCGAVVEFQSAEIERLQEQVVKKHGFQIAAHVHNLYVTCDAWRGTGRCDLRAKQRGRRGPHG
jgi:Fur family ferric uptake transcriptional regulator